MKKITEITKKNKNNKRKINVEIAIKSRDGNETNR